VTGEGRAAYGSFLDRLVAYSLDMSLVATATILVTGNAGAVIETALRPLEGWQSLRRLMTGQQLQFRLGRRAIHLSGAGFAPRAWIAPFLVFNVLAWLYFTVQEASPAHATLGKRLLGMAVQREDGADISLARANARYWSKFFSDETFCVGYLLILFTARRQALHDLVARTVVRRTGDQPALRRFLERRLPGKIYQYQ
jgi:uncharacterized RDD family membrane protein YckC